MCGVDFNPMILNNKLLMFGLGGEVDPSWKEFLVSTKIFLGRWSFSSETWNWVGEEVCQTLKPISLLKYAILKRVI